MLINTFKNKYPYSVPELKKDYPQLSFPKNIESTDLSFIGVFPVRITAQPDYDSITSVIQEGNPKLDQGQWYQTWVVVELDEGSIKANLEEKLSSTKSLVVQRTQERLDAFARTRNYDGILSACTYATSNIPKFAAEGQVAVNLRDATWAALYQILEEVQAGQREVPTGFSDIEHLLPPLEWPV